MVVQTEDEISAINMAVGAAHGGARVSTSTSGPGFSLMVEGIGFASMTEAAGPSSLSGHVAAPVPVCRRARSRAICASCFSPATESSRIS